MTGRTTVPPGVLSPTEIPPLEPGDVLSREEFERRYDAMPDLKKAELIEGVVYMPSPVRLNRHGSPHAALVGWLINYWANTPGVQVGDNSSIRLDLDNEPQPDAVMLIDPARGGQAQISADDYVEGAPEFVAEVAASTASIDLNAKLLVYRRNAVREYLVWRVLDGVLDWFVLRQSLFQRLQPDAAGIYRSETFPGLWLDGPALLRLDLGAVLKVLQQGLATPEHAAFVTKLQQAGGPTP
jgi:Uma2 family endonuclease